MPYAQKTSHFKNWSTCEKKLVRNKIEALSIKCILEALKEYVSNAEVFSFFFWKKKMGFFYTNESFKMPKLDQR